MISDIEDLVNHKQSVHRYRNDDETITFRRLLLEWYHKNRRKLPWRGDDMSTTTTTTTPSSSTSPSASPSVSSKVSSYSIWVSEIMSQQTRIETVIEYHNRWMKQFPTIKSLAEATIEQVNAVWAGLGYYRRAHYLHQGWFVHPTQHLMMR
jgi:A/G-specific adenine glycosylase